MKIYNLDDVLEIIRQNETYKKVSLVNSSREIIVPGNAYGLTKRNEKLQEIRKRFSSQGLKDGIYYILAESGSAKARALSDEFAIQKGEGKTDVAPTQTIIIQEKEKNNDPGENVLSYQKALERETELAQAKVDLVAAQRRIIQLETENEALKKELEDVESEHLSEGENQSFWEKLAEMAMPMLDKHFELREKALNLEAVKLGMMPGQAKPAQQARPTQQAANAAREQQRINEAIQAYINGFSDNPETYEALAAIYNDAENLDDFMKKLQIFNPEYYNELAAGL